MSRPAAFAIPIFIAAAVAASCLAWQEHRQLEADATLSEKAALLASEDASLRSALADAQRKAVDAENSLRRGQIERAVTVIRDLPFKQPVVYQSLDRAGIRQVVADKLSQEYTDKEIQDMANGYSALGLLPPDFPLKQTYIDLLGEQIAAFYDQHQHKLFMFQDASLDDSQNRIILAHELTHALQDQNFGLLKLPLEVQNDDDEAEAASALIEGDATLVMSQYMIQDFSWRTLSDTASYSATQSMVEIRRAPRYLREMLVFPYIQGERFCEAVFERGGFPALSAVYADPPKSTSQILHPERYFRETRQDPVMIDFPNTTFNGQKPLADNILGEMGCRVLFGQSLDEASAEKTAAGWRGDRYLVFDGGDELVWQTVWDSPDDARAAAEALENETARRLGFAFNGSDPLRSSGGKEGHFASVQLDGRGGFTFILATSEKLSNLLYDQFVRPPSGAAHG
jgi:Zn-dependent peptidase ImmA (M78 family)